MDIVGFSFGGMSRSNLRSNTRTWFGD